MKIINPNCLCRNCKFQLRCKNHILGIKVQNLAQYIGESFTTMCIKVAECKKYQRY